MKKYSPYVVLCVLLFTASCTKAPINNDPVIGIWVKSAIEKSAENKSAKTELEWIFNDAYLGRYHHYENKKLLLQTDFSWSKENDTYTISYPGTDRPDDVVKLISSTTLQTNDGNILAERE